MRAKENPVFSLKQLSVVAIVAVGILLAGVFGAAQGAEDTSDTTLLYGSYLGAASVNNEAVAVEINPAREIVVALNSGTTGQIRRYSSDGTTMLAATDVGGIIEDMDINRTTGDIAVVGDFGLKIFDAAAASADPARSKDLGTGNRRVSISSAGLVVTSAGNSLSTWSNTGELLGETTITNGRTVFDVAISAEHNQVYVGGYRQASPNYQSPFLYAYPNDLSSQVWRSYDYWQSLVDAASPYPLTADSRLYRIAIGRDGGLYILGEAHGGTTVFKTNGARWDGMQGSDLEYISPVKIDNWNGMHNTNSATKAFFGEVNPTSGLVERGQFILPRWPNGNDVPGAGSSTRSYRVDNGSIAVDEEGNVAIGASAGSYIKGRFENTLTINGQPLGPQPESDKEVAIYIVDPSFSTRHTWTVLTKDQGDGIVSGFAMAYGISAFVGISYSGELFTTADAAQAAPYNGASDERNDAYLGVLSAGDVLSGVAIQGPTVGFAGEPFTLVAQVSPQTAQPPFTYVWEADGQSTITHADMSSTSDTVTFEWASTGTNNVTVTVTDAENNQVVDSLTVDIRQLRGRSYIPVLSRP
jgi:hypothetical protein